MPLSKVRDRERKRLARLENKNVQPKRLYPVQPKDMESKLRKQGIAIDGNRIVRVAKPVQPMYMAGGPINTVELDADGNMIPEYI